MASQAITENTMNIDDKTMHEYGYIFMSVHLSTASDAFHISVSWGFHTAFFHQGDQPVGRVTRIHTNSFDMRAVCCLDDDSCSGRCDVRFDAGNDVMTVVVMVMSDCDGYDDIFV